MKGETGEKANLGRGRNPFKWVSPPSCAPSLFVLISTSALPLRVLLPLDAATMAESKHAAPPVETGDV